MPTVDLSKVHTFTTASDFSHWLAANSEIETELWIKIYKKGSGKLSLNWQEAVIESLCWGWIDGVRKTLDDEAYYQRFTPRRAGSNWSKRNTEHVEALIKNDRMQEAGLRHVQAAKMDGRWQAAYSSSKDMVIPADFLMALDSNLAAKRTFEKLTKSKKFIIYYQLISAKKSETRDRRFNKLIALLENNEELN